MNKLVAKAIRSNVEIIIAVGAISSAAETLSRNSGITLVGFASREKPVVIGPLTASLTSHEHAPAL